VCRADSATFCVVVPADSVSGFRDHRHRPVAADNARKMFLLAEVPAGSAGATVVVAVVVVLAVKVALVGCLPGGCGGPGGGPGGGSRCGSS
jgi:hypothetical protein